MALTQHASSAGSRKLSSNRSFSRFRVKKNRSSRLRKIEMADTSNVRIAVVGGGPGGYAAAFLAADLGMKVTLIDPEVNPGGVCLYRGCIPSKALLHVAKVIHETREAAAWGLKFAEPEIDLDAMSGWKEKVVGKL